jgi:C4-dicarboxylate transporter DctM subunit
MMESQILLFLIFGVAFLFLLFSGWLIAFAMAGASTLAYIFMAGEGAIGNIVVHTYNAMFNYDLLALPIFILMGELLIQGGVAGKLYDSVLPLMERIPGGLVHTNIIANVILGACTGSTIAATTAMSTVAVPELNKRGYDKKICYGSLTSAGCLACLIPPSVGMILFASITTVSLGKLFIAGIIPGLILAAAFSLVVFIWVKLQPNIVPVPPKKLMPLGVAVIFALKNMWPILVLIFMVLGAIYFGIGTATESGCYGICGALVLGYKTINLETIKRTLFSTLQISGGLLIVIAMASVYGFALNSLGMRQSLLSLLGGLPGGAFTKMYLIWLMLLILGMFIDSASIIVITTPIFMPFAVGLGYDPIWFGVFMMLAVELGNITPPVGVTLFAVQAAAKEQLDIVAKGSFPFWASFFLAMTICTYFPAIVTWLPGMGAG